MARTFQFQVPGKRLLVALLLTVVPLSLLALYTTSNASREFEGIAGQHLRSAAVGAAEGIQERVRSKVIEAALIASDSAIVAAAHTSNRSYGRASDDEIRKQIEAQDAIWNTPRGQQLSERLLANSASQALRRHLTLTPAFLRISVTDLHGASIAASHKTLDYNQADEEFWKDIYSSGRGTVSVTDVLYDEATQHQYVGVGVPVFDENHVLIGTLDALVDIAALSPLLNRTDLGGGRMALVNADGSIIAASGGAMLSELSQSIDHGAIQDSISRLDRRDPSYFKAAFPGGEERLVAFAETGLMTEFHNLDWTVVASQDTAVVLASASRSQALIMLIAMLSLAAVVFLAVYFSLHRQSDIEELEELRHSGQAV